MKHHPPHRSSRSSRSSRSRRLRRVTCHLYQSHGTCLGPYLRLAASLWKATNGRQVRQLFLKRHPLSQNRYLHSAEHTYSDVSNTWNLSLFEDNAGYTADLKDNKDTGTDGQHFGLQVADGNAITYHLPPVPIPPLLMQHDVVTSTLLPKQEGNHTPTIRVQRYPPPPPNN